MSKQTINQKQKGTLVRKMRSLAIKLFIPTFIIVIFLLSYAIIKIGIVPKFEKSPFGYYAMYFIIKLFTFSKKKLDIYTPWYKSVWGWDIFILLLFIIFFLIPMLLTTFIINDKDNKTELYSANFLSNNLNVLTESVGLVECYGENFYINKDGETFFYRDDEQAYINITAQGSASLWKIDNIKYILTNKHVLNKQNHCLLRSIDLNIPLNNFSEAVYNNNADAVFIPIEEDKIEKLKRSFPRFYSDSDFNGTENQFIFSHENMCDTKESMGSKVYTLGFPAYTSTTKEYTKTMGEEEKEVGVVGLTSTITISEGIISAYTEDENLPYVNYYTSAKVDSGNSGGIAFMENEKDKLCILGVPTWLNLGDYETGGIIQNIHNIMYRKE